MGWPCRQRRVRGAGRFTLKGVERVTTAVDFAVDDDGKADWACRKAARRRAAMDRRAAFMEVEVARLRDW